MSAPEPSGYLGSPEERAVSRVTSRSPADEGLAVVVETGQMGRTVQLLACTECGVLLWDVEVHWVHAHGRRLQAIRARS